MHATRNCSTDDCDRHATVRGMCQRHYDKARRDGTITWQPRPKSHAENVRRFWLNVDKRTPNECWPWLGLLSPHGYGQFTVDGRKVAAHRWSYELHIGLIPDGLEFDHVRARGCTRTNCVNPAHLEPVTHRENVLRGTSPTATNAEKPRCPNGHEYRPRANNRRYCQQCKNAWERRKRARLRAAR